jgi:hypothetical protein
MDAKGLSLVGLAALEGSDRTVEAIATYGAARAITCAPGIVGRVKRLRDALAPDDSMRVLARVRQAAEGPQRR